MRYLNMQRSHVHVQGMLYSLLHAKSHSVGSPWVSSSSISLFDTSESSSSSSRGSTARPPVPSSCGASSDGSLRSSTSNFFFYVSSTTEIYTTDSSSSAFVAILNTRQMVKTFGIVWLCLAVCNRERSQVGLGKRSKCKI